MRVLVNNSERLLNQHFHFGTSWHEEVATVDENGQVTALTLGEQ